MLVVLSGVSGAGKDTIKKELIKRMEEKHAIHTVNTANKLGVGNLEYELIDIDNK